jgi:hypothetical protein
MANIMVLNGIMIYPLPLGSFYTPNKWLEYLSTRNRGPGTGETHKTDPKFNKIIFF